MTTTRRRTTLRPGSRLVITWVERHHFARLNDRTRRVVCALLEADARDEVRTALAVAGLRASTARGALEKKRLPSPARWRALGRGLQIAQAVQWQREASTEDLAEQFGYADHTAIAHQLRRTFGVTVTELRARSGRIWLVRRWWAQSETAGGVR